MIVTWQLARIGKQARVIIVYLTLVLHIGVEALLESRTWEVDVGGDAGVEGVWGEVVAVEFLREVWVMDVVNLRVSSQSTVPWSRHVARKLSSLLLNNFLLPQTKDSGISDDWWNQDNNRQEFKALTFLASYVINN